MDSISDQAFRPVDRKLSGKISMEDHYKAMIQEQNAQIYSQYGRISDLLEEKIKLQSQVERLTQLLESK